MQVYKQNAEIDCFHAIIRKVYDYFREYEISETISSRMKKEGLDTAIKTLEAVLEYLYYLQETEKLEE